MALITDLANVRANRPFKPRYAWTQATAQAWKLGEVSGALPTIVPGMCMKVSAAGYMIPATAATDTVAGFCGNYSKELEALGSDEIAVWVLTPDAIFATETFDATTITSGTTIGAPLYSNANGKLSATGGSNAVAACRFMGFEGTKTILIAGLL